MFTQDADSIGLSLASSEFDLLRHVGPAAGGALLLSGGLAGGYLGGLRRTSA